ncbi:MAG: biotin/lipoyl-containing protein [Cellulosilyticaceae bacterium]
MKKFRVNVNGNTYDVEVEELSGTSMQPVSQGNVSEVRKPQVAKPIIENKAPVIKDGTNVVAPMPGKIVSVKVKVGESIKEGDLVAVLEAMKMENEIFATTSGTVAAISVSEGAMIEANDVIITIN